MKADEIVRSLLDETCIHNDRHAKAGCSRCVQNAFVDAIASARKEGRAAGYAEAIEKAVAIADKRARESAGSASQVNAQSAAAFDIVDAIRALAPADPPCAQCGFPKNCHAENPVTAHRYAPADKEKP